MVEVDKLPRNLYFKLSGMYLSLVKSHIICIEFFAFVVNLISSNKHNFDISQVDYNYTWITFVTLNRFCPLSNPPPPPLFLMDNIKMERIRTNQNQKKNTCPFYIVFQVLKVFLIKIYKIQPLAPHLLFLVAFISFNTSWQISIFTNF